MEGGRIGAEGRGGVEAKGRRWRNVEEEPRGWGAGVWSRGREEGWKGRKEGKGLGVHSTDEHFLTCIKSRE